MKKFRTHCQKELAYLEHLDAIQEHVGLDPDVPMIVCEEARDMAAKLGLAELVTKAPEKATLATARVYVAECLAECQAAPRLPQEGLLSLRQAAVLLGYTPKGLRKIVARERNRVFSVEAVGTDQV